MKTIKNFLHFVMLLLAVVMGVSCLTSCSDNNDSPALPSIEEMEQSLVGLWFDEFDYAGKLEDTGEEFTSVALAMQVNKDYTGCLYAGAFNDGDYDNPIVVKGGPEEAGFTWQLTSSGDLIMTATNGSGSITLACTRADGSAGDDMRNLTNVNGWETKIVDGQTVIYRDANVLTPANTEQTAIINNMVNGETFTLATLNADGMPKQILFFDVNTEGPAEKYSPAIARYLINKNFDIILTQENFNYNAELTAPFDSAG